MGFQGFSIDRLRGRFFIFGLDDWRTRDLHHLPSPGPPRREPEREQLALPPFLVHDPLIIQHHRQTEILGGVQEDVQRDVPAGSHARSGMG